MELLRIKMLNTAVERIMNREMLDLGLTYTQTTVIGYLIENEKNNICQKDIEHNLGLTHPTVSSILNRMEKGGLIIAEIMPSDNRYKRILLTDKARGLTKQINERYLRVKEKLFEGVSPAQRELMNITMQMILKNAR